MGSGSPSKTENVLPPGTMIGEFRIGEKLGEGGMGVVYAGQHPVIGKRVAVKVLSSECASNPDLVRRFLEEARAVNRIGHPNIIDIFSFGQLPDGRQYFVMEFLDGESLADRLEKGDIEPGELRRLLRQICSALEAAHRVGIIHRDLKPENIWIATPNQEDAYVKLLDFGIAKLVDLDTAKITQTGAAMGSPQFMPPEQFMGQSIDRRADIYAMGVILYRIFTGRLPFEGKSIPELVYQQTTQAPVPPSRHRRVDPDIERIILDCLEKEPNRRPGTARELGERLERAFTKEKERTARPQRVRRHVAIATPMETAVPRLANFGGQSSGVGRVVGSHSSAFEGELARVPRTVRRRVLLMGAGLLIVSTGAIIVSRTRSNSAVGPVITEVRAPAERSKVLPSAEQQVARVRPLGPEVKPLFPPPKADVAIHIQSVPPGARVVSTADGSVLGKTPVEIVRPRGPGSLAIKLDLRGWKSISAEVSLGDDFDHSYDLEKIVAPVQKVVMPAASLPGLTPAAPSPPASSPPPSLSPQRRWSDPFAIEPAHGRAIPKPSVAPTTPISPSSLSPSAPSAPRPIEPARKTPLRI